MKVKFTPTVPTKPGKYIRKDLLGFISIITVIEYPESSDFGVKIPKYLGIVEMNGRNIDGLRKGYNQFSEAIEEES